MERVKTLIKKLQQQLEKNLPAEELLTTVNLLQSELLAESDSFREVLRTDCVHVIAPQKIFVVRDAKEEEESIPVFQEEIKLVEEEPDVLAEEIKEEAKNEDIKPDESTEKVQEVQVDAIPSTQDHPLTDVSKREKLITTDTVIQPAELSGQTNIEKPKRIVFKLEQGSLDFPNEVDNELIDTDEQLETESEPDEVVSDDYSPIKDLRKAISEDDKFRFINNLFDGDDSEYRRSIKAIQNFSILPEAEYWIRRELRIKHGWDNSDPLVKKFDSLVKRRFA